MTDAQVEITHDGLEPEGEDVPTTGVYVSIFTATGMRYGASSYVEGEATTDQLVELVRGATDGAAAAYSPELHRRINGAVQS